MHTDHSIDDELDPGESDAVIRNSGKVECSIRIADIHHDFDRNLGQRVEFYPGFLEFESAVVDQSFVALGAAHGYLRAILDSLGRVAAADDGRNGRSCPLDW